MRITSIYVVLVSFLMVSLIEYDVSGYFFFGDIRKHWFRSLIHLLILGTVFFYPSLAFFLMAAFYVFYGPGRYLVRLVGRRNGEAGEEIIPESQP